MLLPSATGHVCEEEFNLIVWAVVCVVLVCGVANSSVNVTKFASAVVSFTVNIVSTRGAPSAK